MIPLQAMQDAIAWELGMTQRAEEACERAARAALTALSENVTEAMVEAGLRASEDYFVGDKVTAEGFRIGIRAMLAEAGRWK